MPSYNYASILAQLGRFEEARSLLRKIPPAQMFSVFGENNEITLTMRLVYAQVVILGPSPTPAALCKAVSTLEDTARIARRVLGGAHPSTEQIEVALRKSRAALDKLRAAIAAAEARAPNPPPPNILQRIPKPDLDALRAETAGSFQRASEEKLRTRRIVSVAGRFRHPAATRPTPGSDDSRSISTDAPPPGSA